MFDNEQPMDITLLPNTRRVKIEKDGQFIFINTNNFEKFAREIADVKRWLTST